MYPRTKGYRPHTIMAVFRGIHYHRDCAEHQINSNQLFIDESNCAEIFTVISSSLQCFDRWTRRNGIAEKLRVLGDDAREAMGGPAPKVLNYRQSIGDNKGNRHKAKRNFRGGCDRLNSE
jgi:hypothetical protein